MDAPIWLERTLAKWNGEFRNVLLPGTSKTAGEVSDAVLDILTLQSPTTPATSLSGRAGKQEQMMNAIPFTQFLRPNGRPAQVSIERPSQIVSKAESIIASGYRFECEELIDGTVSLTITDPDEGDLDIELVRNGLDVPPAVDRLVERFSGRAALASTKEAS